MRQGENHRGTDLTSGIASPNSSQRLASAMAAGTYPNDSLIDTLIERCAVEPDFFVRDMLTWALLRHDHKLVYPKLLDQLNSSTAQARSQALHTLTKIGRPDSWKHISDDLLFDEDAEVARAAWRLAANLSPEAERHSLATKLIKLLGSGDQDFKMSLSRALVQLGEVARIPLVEQTGSKDDLISNHANFTIALLDNPELGQNHAVGFAAKLDLLRGAPKVPNEDENLS